ncbi:MAG TPA: DUF1839 family protein [Polyangia bacterium]|nr:DUF1839 family protein [Polyangia bacterium]
MTAAVVEAIPGLEAANYQRHTLHADDRVWVEKNCYIDVWIELVHALGCEPMAVMPFVLAIDFEGDQWTFFKPPHDELRRLYGLDVQELNVWRPLLDHALEHLPAGKVISTEADAFWLPDTQGTDYRRQHTKTTIILNRLDVAGKRLQYFHNASYHALEGEDFDRTFRVGAPADPTFMPLFAEIVRTKQVARLSGDQLRALSREILAVHLARRPADNPVRRFAARFARDLPALTEQGLATYHAWAFGTIRQLGAAFELATLYTRWLGDGAVEAAAPHFEAISSVAKVFILKAARAVNAKRALDAEPMFAEMAEAWQRGMDILAEATRAAK